MIYYLIYAVICLFLKSLGLVIFNLDIKSEHPDKDMQAAISIVNIAIKVTILHLMPYMVIRNLIKKI